MNRYLKNYQTQHTRIMLHERRVPTPKLVTQYYSCKLTCHEHARNRMSSVGGVQLVYENMLRWAAEPSPILSRCYVALI
jgi:hypothetical protein